MFKIHQLVVCLSFTCLSFATFATLGAEQLPAPADGKTDLSSEGFGPNNVASSTALAKKDEKKQNVVDSQDQKSTNLTSEGFGPYRAGNADFKDTESRNTTPKNTGSTTGAQSEGFGPNTGSSPNNDSNAGARNDRSAGGMGH